MNANAAAARQQASAFSLAADDIIADVDSMESTKIAALETEAVLAEAVLERLDDSDPTEIPRAIYDASQLPTRPVEPSHLQLTSSVQCPSGYALIAPRGILAAHVELTAPPRFAHPGNNATLRVSLSTAYLSRLPEEMEIATAHLSLVRRAGCQAFL